MNKVVKIQYSNGDRIDDVKLIQDNLKENGWISPRSDLVEGTYSDVIKFFHSEDSDLAFEIRKTIGEHFRIVGVRNFEKKVPVIQLEVWINNK